MRLLCFVLVFISGSAYAQKTVHGQVRDKTDKYVLPGVSVIEKGTANGVQTDEDGRFTIVCIGANPVLEFSSVGTLSKTITPDTDPILVYLEDSYSDDLIMGRFPDEDCVIYEKTLAYTAIGFNSGLNYTPLGGNITNVMPVLFGLNMMTTTSITYRTDLHASNKFFDLAFTKRELIHFRSRERYLNLALRYNNRKIADDEQHWNSETFTILPELQFDRILFRAGYGWQSMNNTETLGSNRGFAFGLGYKLYKSQLIFVSTATRWNNYWQTETSLTKKLNSNNFEVGIRVETLGANYRELDLLVKYRIRY